MADMTVNPQGTGDADLDTAAASILDMMGGEENDPRQKKGGQPAEENANPNPNEDERNEPGDNPDEDDEYITLPDGYTVDEKGNVFDPEGNLVERDENGELLLPGDNPEDDAGKQKFEVKVGDETLEVTLDELKAGYMKDADYRRKTAEVAEMRKAVEAQSHALQEAEGLQNQLIGAYAALHTIQQQLSAYDQVDWQTLESTNLNEFIRHKEARRDLIDAYNQLTQGIQQFQAQKAQQKQQETVKLMQEQAEILKRDIKGFNGQTAKALIQYASDAFGFTPDELGQVLDARQIKVLHKAYLYDQLQSGKGMKVKRVKELPQKVVHSGPRGNTNVRTEQRVKAVNRVKQTGDVRDAAAAIMHLLPD